MKLGFVIKIIKTVFKIGGNVKIGNNMPATGTTVNAAVGRTVGISASTPIIFTVKSFFATFGSLLSLLVGFYFAILVPSMKNSTDTQKELYDKLYQEQKGFIITQFNEMKGSIGENTKAIGVNTTALNATTARFNDLNDAVESLHDTGGSFGDNTTTTGGLGTDPHD
jgi:hypothetical protein